MIHSLRALKSNHLEALSCILFGRNKKCHINFFNKIHLPDRSMFIFPLICFIVDNFGKQGFNSTDSSFDFPYVIFPYFPEHQPQKTLFDHFQSTEEQNPDIATATLDCLNNRTICSKFKLRPGYVHISYPPHNNIIKTKRQINNESLDRLSKSVQHRNLQDFSSIDEIYGNASLNIPVFVLAARPNAGDLEDKYPVFESLVMKFIGEDIIFSFVTDSSIYAQLTTFPRTDLIYISPYGQKVIFDDEDFILPQVVKFVNQHKYPVLMHLFETQNAFSNLDLIETLSLVVVDEKIENDVEIFIQKMTPNVPLLFLNRTKYPILSASICMTNEDINEADSKTKSCYAIVNFTNSKAIRIDTLNETVINEVISNFDEIHAKLPLKYRLMRILFFTLQFRGKVVVLYSIVSIVFLVFFAGLFITLIDFLEPKKLKKK
ncbi:hypothetical protein TRFO_27754 [Tritrichomonas foetus]|uniref:Thioredoxin domain-containing protein n=1 Tax=Tritrichomonas foetus TaxID=1144522 RepID=A0A1J4K4J9_9EUKA|nr:hypothetical protein TRFO_27754 [Tritrichomonas foetus]|eukprot:OHT04676.1 hypothetical protein TRFO_27754 [Tritrichomonas foetus]